MLLGARVHRRDAGGVDQQARRPERLPSPRAPPPRRRPDRTRRPRWRARPRRSPRPRPRHWDDVRATTATRAPSAARARAMARPMPRPPPVTRATRPAKRRLSWGMPRTLPEAAWPEDPGRHARAGYGSPARPGARGHDRHLAAAGRHRRLNRVAFAGEASGERLPAMRSALRACLAIGALLGLIVATAASAAPPPSDGVVDLLTAANAEIVGPSANARTRTVGGGGDVNGDGLADVLVGSPEVSATGRPRAGSVWVLAGRTQPADVDLAAPARWRSPASTEPPPSTISGGSRSCRRGRRWRRRVADILIVGCRSRQQRPRWLRVGLRDLRRRGPERRQPGRAGRIRRAHRRRGPGRVRRMARGPRGRCEP